MDSGDIIGWRGGVVYGLSLSLSLSETGQILTVAFSVLDSGSMDFSGSFG
jgi:hypothetical protein